MDPLSQLTNSDNYRHYLKLKVELETARKLARKLQQILWKDMRAFKADGFEFSIAYVLFLRAERTYLSIRTLSRLRQVDDAFALVRVMVEKVINAEYIYLSGTATAMDYLSFFVFREWRDFKALQELSPELTPNYSPEHLKMLQDAHDYAELKTFPDGSTKTRFGRGNDWIEIGLGRRAADVDEMLRAKFALIQPKSTRILYELAYKKGAVYVHGTFASLARSLRSEHRDDDDNDAADGTVSVTVGIRIRDQPAGVAAEAMHTANLAAMSLILFIGKIFDKKEYLNWTLLCKNTYAEELRKVRKTATA